MAHNVRWWQRGIIYQVYPFSFMDSNGDGIGDLAGIIERLDYLRWLGVDGVWITPFFPSPMADFGYDVSDYTAIDPVFGTLKDFDRLVARAHDLGLKVILDYVANHTSEQHPWFLESRSSRDNPKREWYIWRDPAPGGGPPNNWRAIFGGSGWEWDEHTGQYYYHAFLPQQPDLNWRNPEVQRAMLDVLRFWLDRDVDGFRVDVMWHVIKDEQFRDNPPNSGYRPGDDPYTSLLPVYSCDRPEVHDIVAKMRAVLDEYGERLLIGELYLPLDRVVTYYGVNNGGCHLPYNFQLIMRPWDAATVGATIQEYEALLPPGTWPNWVLGNHDRHRVATRIGMEQARVAAMLLLTLRGTPTIYQGEELGMHDVEVPPEMVHDPVEWRLPGLAKGRDGSRTPMPWDPSPTAGFTTGRPWLPLSPDYHAFNVQTEREDPRSMLSLHRRLIDLRRAEPALEVGAVGDVAVDGDLLAYTRVHDESRFHVVLNLGHHLQHYHPAGVDLRGSLILSTRLDREGEAIDGAIRLRPDEGVVMRLLSSHGRMVR